MLLSHYIRVVIYITWTNVYKRWHNDFSINDINHTSYSKDDLQFGFTKQMFSSQGSWLLDFHKLFSWVYKIIAISKHFQNKVFNYDSSSRVLYCNIYKAMNLTHSQNLCTRRHIFADSFSHMFQEIKFDVDARWYGCMLT